MKRACLIGVIAVFVSGLVTQGTLAADVGVGIRAGTQGLGVEGAIGFTRWLTLRAGAYRGSLSDDFEESGNDYNGELTVGGAGVLADFFPLRGSFRLTGGWIANDNEIEFDTVPTSPIEIGDGVYEPDDVGRLDGRVDFDSSAPYAGIGWGNVAGGRGRVGFLFDLGAVFQGSPRVDLRRSSMAAVPGLDQDIEREAAEIEEDIDDYDVWPVIAFGLAVRF